MLAIYLRMMDFAKAPVILSPPLHLMDILAGQMLSPAEKTRFENQERGRRPLLCPGDVPPGGAWISPMRSGCGIMRCRCLKS